MLKLPVKSPIVNGDIDLSEYAKKSDVDAIDASLDNKAEKKDVEELSSQLDNITNMSEKKNIKIVAGVIRNNGNGWEFIIDNVHDKMNSTTLEVNGDFIKYNFPFTAKKVLSFVAVPDETMSNKNYLIGSSVGTQFANIQISKNYGIFGNIRKENGNFVVKDTGKTGINSIVFDSNTNVLTINHDALGGYFQTIENRNKLYDVDIYTSSPTATSIIFSKDKIGGYIYYDGVNITKANDIGITSVVWNSSMSAFEITHEASNIFDAIVSSRTLYDAKIESIGTNKTYISFYNNNVKVTNLDTNMKITFSRTAPAKNLIPLDGEVNFNLLSTQPIIKVLNPSEVIEPSGNIWCMGVFEV